MKPTADELAGITWWNGLSEEDRAFWLRAALTSVPAEAWAYYKRANADLPASVPVAPQRGRGQKP